MGFDNVKKIQRKNLRRINNYFLPKNDCSLLSPYVFTSGYVEVHFPLAAALCFHKRLCRSAFSPFVSVTFGVWIFVKIATPKEIKRYYLLPY